MGRRRKFSEVLAIRRYTCPFQRKWGAFAPARPAVARAVPERAGRLGDVRRLVNKLRNMNVLGRGELVEQGVGIARD
jgi:hypothetical protein